MPIVERPENDLLRLAPICNALVNPVNCSGVQGKGLALAFKTAYPGQFEAYQKKFYEGKLKIGHLHIYQGTDTPVIINLPTKDHWRDPSTVEYITLGLKKLRDYLVDNPYFTVALPILGGGYGGLPHETVIPLFYEYLDDLPNIVHLTKRPQDFPKLPVYVGIIGDRKFDDYSVVKDAFLTALKEWNLQKEDIDAIISGGAKGVDSCAISKDPDKECITNEFGLRPVIAEADWERYGRAAGMIRNRTVVDIVTHCVALPTKQSIGTKGAINLIIRHNEEAVNHTAEYEENPHLRPKFCYVRNV